MQATHAKARVGALVLVVVVGPIGAVRLAGSAAEEQAEAGHADLEGLGVRVERRQIVECRDEILAERLLRSVQRAARGDALVKVGKGGERDAQGAEVPLFQHGEGGWIADGQYRMLSGQSLATRHLVAGKLLWWLRREKIAGVDTAALRCFLAYLVTGHEAEGGRWENEANPHRHKKARPATVWTYFVVLDVLFTFLVSEEAIAASPMAALKPPRIPADQIQPFSEPQVKSLLLAATKSRYPRRDTALILFLLDTGCRAAEAVALKMSNLNLTEGYALVTGKGNKLRRLHLSSKTRRAVASYLRQEGRAGPRRIQSARRRCARNRVSKS